MPFIEFGFTSIKKQLGFRNAVFVEMNECTFKGSNSLISFVHPS